MRSVSLRWVLSTIFSCLRSSSACSSRASWRLSSSRSRSCNSPRSRRSSFSLSACCWRAISLISSSASRRRFSTSTWALRTISRASDSASRRRRRSTQPESEERQQHAADNTATNNHGDADCSRHDNAPAVNRRDHIGRGTSPTTAVGEPRRRPTGRRRPTLQNGTEAERTAYTPPQGGDCNRAVEPRRADEARQHVYAQERDQAASSSNRCRGEFADGGDRRTAQSRKPPDTGATCARPDDSHGRPSRNPPATER